MSADPAHASSVASPDSHDTIHVRGARANNLKNIDVDIPKRRLTVFTGVSGSGKSSLVFGTVAAESRRLIDETYSAFVQGFMPSLPRPDVDVLENLSPAIIIDQERMGANSRSTVGTATDVSSLVRILFSRLSTPYVGASGHFSFNLPEGWCPTCEGTGTGADIDLSTFLDEDKTLNEGAIDAPGFNIGDWYWTAYARNDRLDPDKPIRDFTEEEREFFLYAPTQKLKVAKEDNSGFSTTTYDGLVTRIRRLWIDRDTPPKQKQIVNFVEKISTTGPCPDCHGARLKEASRTATVAGRTIAEWNSTQVTELRELVVGLEEEVSVDAGSVGPVRSNLLAMLDNLIDVGLGYLSLDRPAGTLSGGEAQRVKMIRHLGSSLSDVTYVFDEPTIGLHPHDIARMNELLQRIRDKGNTVLVVEHKPEVIAAADHVVDIGPGSGEAGGEVVFTGSYEELLGADTTTAHSLEAGLSLRDSVRTPTGHISLEHLTENNLQDVAVDVPTGVLTVVTGVAGSGKSSMVHGGLAGRSDVTVVDQSGIRGSRRSTPVTYTGMLDDIRKLFARANKDAGATPAHFSPNSTGACPMCNGLGVVYTDLAIMAGVAATCEECGGKRFRPEVLEFTLAGRTISDVLDMTVRGAREYFAEDVASGKGNAATRAVVAVLDRLVQVGLEYLRLGQPLNTLSGGERQRLKLAAKIGEGLNGSVIVLDEPTSGLHLADTGTLVTMMQSLVDDGHSLVVIEHNLAVVAAADQIIDVGPGAGHEGGTVVFTGTPAELVAQSEASDTQESLTGRYLAAAVAD
ncbi:MAG TPA: excinuclease ABC subunit UvrA [Candidatus Corynebacterium avicola]|uniref:UvrABC system protein A n=1 Tax=Candidatus Corynebacterium avicola TaxID=2838527 RepID=A0A9D1ULF6_9CORY|nr:excinuclease ABC subunit UvrA [Candidatus Corynebacterium avicola]